MGMTPSNLFVLQTWLSTIIDAAYPLLAGTAIVFGVVLLIAIMCPLARDDVPPPIDNWQKKKPQGANGNLEK